MNYEQASFADQAAPTPRRGEYPSPSGARIEYCKSCDAVIVWARTERGRAVPLSLVTAEMRDGVAYLLSHFADCPESREWSTR